MKAQSSTVGAIVHIAIGNTYAALNCSHHTNQRLVVTLSSNVGGQRGIGVHHIDCACVWLCIVWYGTSKGLWSNIGHLAYCCCWTLLLLAGVAAAECLCACWCSFYHFMFWGTCLMTSQHLGDAFTTIRLVEHTPTMVVLLLYFLAALHDWARLHSSNIRPLQWTHPCPCQW